MANRKPAEVNLSRLNQQQAANLLGVTSRTLRDWADAPRNGDGSYDGPQLVRWFVERAAGNTEFDNQRERLAAAQAEKVETDNALRRGEIVLVQSVVEEVGDYITTCCARLRNIGGKAATEFDPDTGRRVETIVDREVEAAIAELREYRPRSAVGTAGRPLDA